MRPPRNSASLLPKFKISLAGRRSCRGRQEASSNAGSTHCGSCARFRRSRSLLCSMGLGREQLHVSRLAMDVISSNIDLSKEPQFAEAVAHKVYYGPVYFRRESEPYMTLALAGTRRETG